MANEALGQVARRASIAVLIVAMIVVGLNVLGFGAIRVGVLGRLQGLEAAYADDSSVFAGGLIHAGLYRSDASLAPQPVLASSAAESSNGGQTWKVQLRRGLTFHDGSALTADDVIFTYELAKSNRCPLLAEICDLVRTNLDSVESTGEFSVTFNLQETWSPWATRGMTIPILPKAALEASLARLQRQLANADRSEVSLARESLAAALDPSFCGDAGTAQCAYAPHLAELERILGAAGLTLPDPRSFPEVDLSGSPTGARDSEAYAQDLFARLGSVEAILMAPIQNQMEAGFPLLDLQFAPIGAGPYAFKQRVPGSSVQLSAFSNFALGAPKISSLLLTQAPTSARLISAFQSSQLDWVPGLNSTEVTGLDVRGGGELLQTPSLRGYYFLAFNLRSGHLFSDSAARTALASCIDMSTVIDSATGGSGIAISSTVISSSWAAESPAPPETTHNVAAARQVLSGAGWSADADGIFAKAGRRLEAQILVRDGQPARVRAAQSIADQALECGISLTVAPSSYATDILPRLQYPGDFDIYLGGWQWSLDPDDSDLFISSACPTEGVPAGKNFMCWQSDAVDTLLQDGRVGTVLADRAATYADLQALRRADRPLILLWGEPAYSLLAAKFVWPTRATDVSSPLYAWSIETWEAQ